MAYILSTNIALGSACCGGLLQPRWLPLSAWEEKGGALPLVRRQGSEVVCLFLTEKSSMVQFTTSADLV